MDTDSLMNPCPFLPRPHHNFQVIKASSRGSIVSGFQYEPPPLRTLTAEVYISSSNIG